jgi:hypothetical protein
VTTQMAAEKKQFGRRLPDGTRTARAKALTRQRQMARRAAGRDLPLPVLDDQEEE